MSLMPEGIVPTEPVLTILVDMALPRRGSRLPYGGALTGWMHSISSRPDREQRRAAAVPGEILLSISFPFGRCAAVLRGNSVSDGSFSSA